MLRKLTTLIICVCLGNTLGASQAATTSPTPSTATPAQAGSSSAQSAPAAIPALVGFGLEDGTPVRLRLTRNLSSEADKKGDTVDFEVLEDVSAGGLIVIPRTSIALATITEAQPKRRMARGGKLNVNIDSVRLKDGERATLRAVKDTRGGGHVGVMTGAIVATSIVFFPAAPLFLFMHGKSVDIPKGTEITAYVAGNIPLDRTRFEDGEPTAGVVAKPAASLGQTSVTMTSTPTGADVEVDGHFVGNTPSSLNLAAGDHSVKITKKGYKAWERKLTASGGSINLNAELDAL